VFEKVDLIAAPATPSTAFRIGAHSNNPLEMYLEDVFTLPANLAGVPGVSACAGFDSEGLPIGLQMLGPHFSDERLLGVAKTYQAATDWHKREPTL
jgi:aspartyl-tRNA(Asn)/glutamyl-tRNA(Gln) amidotransferase subunit A